jgi:hypothetical protein
MNSERQFIALVLGLPLMGLVYCGLGIAAMVYIPLIRNYPVISGSIFILVPFSLAVFFWIRASAKAYK